MHMLVGIVSVNARFNASDERQSSIYTYLRLDSSPSLAVYPLCLTLIMILETWYLFNAHHWRFKQPTGRDTTRAPTGTSIWRCGSERQAPLAVTSLIGLGRWSVDK